MQRKEQKTAHQLANMIEKMLGRQVFETNPIFVNHDLFRSLARPAELCLNRVNGWVRQLNSRRVHRPAGLAGYRYGNGAFCPVVCDDPMHRAQTGSGRPGAKGLLHTG